MLGNSELKEELLKNKGDIKKIAEELGVSNKALYQRINTTPVLRKTFDSLSLAKRMIKVALPQENKDIEYIPEKNLKSLKVENILKEAEDALLRLLKEDDSRAVLFVLQTLGAKKYSPENVVQTQKEFTISFKSTVTPVPNVIDVNEESN